MKKIFTLCVALFATIATFAQQPMATLDHNDTITVWYGPLAFQNAHNASVSGDIITLSPGEFLLNTTLYGRENITIRGAGMFYDSITGTQPTRINMQYYDVYFGLNWNVEGIWFFSNNNNYTVGGTSGRDHVRISKCRFGRMATIGNGTQIANDCIFNSCVIDALILGESGKGFSNAIFNNCIITNLSGWTDWGMITNRQNQFVHCVIYVKPRDGKYYAYYFNCILWDHDGYGESDEVPYAYYCIGFHTPNNNNYFRNNTYTNNLFNRNRTNTFIDFTGTYDPGVTTFALTPEAQAIMGSDSTQIGIYGGVHPYNPRVDVVPPIIGRVTVPNHSNAEGRLDVNVEIINAQ